MKRIFTILFLYTSIAWGMLTRDGKNALAVLYGPERVAGIETMEQAVLFMAQQSLADQRKELLLRLHPDKNQGIGNATVLLNEAINAHKLLKDGLPKKIYLAPQQSQQESPLMEKMRENRLLRSQFNVILLTNKIKDFFQKNNLLLQGLADRTIAFEYGIDQYISYLFMNSWKQCMKEQPERTWNSDFNISSYHYAEVDKALNGTVVHFDATRDGRNDYQCTTLQNALALKTVLYEMNKLKIMDPHLFANDVVSLPEVECLQVLRDASIALKPVMNRLINVFLRDLIKLKEFGVPLVDHTGEIKMRDFTRGSYERGSIDNLGLLACRKGYKTGSEFYSSTRYELQSFASTACRYHQQIGSSSELIPEELEGQQLFNELKKRDK